MTALSSAAGDITAALRSRDWVLERTSERAALWTLPSSAAELYVPHTLRRDTLEWAGVLERMAAPRQEHPRDIETSLDKAHFDVIRYRVNATGDTIPLETAATVIGNAFGMLRAAATTARKPRQNLYGTYRKDGDKLVAQARLGHTEQGSFIFPVLVHIDEPAPAPAEMLDGVQEVTPESDERRVTRTLAQAMQVIEKHVVQPDEGPSARSLLPVVYAGGSKELLTKLATTLADPDIAFLETNFTWAGVESAGRDMPTSVVIPAGASKVIAHAASVLGKARNEPVRAIVGPIIRIEHELGDMFGEIVIQAAPAGDERRSRVEVRVRADQMGELHDWMHAGTTVVVQGRLERRPSRYARFEGVGYPQALDDSLNILL